MEKSRLTRVKNKKATRQAIIYIVLSVLIIVGTIGWGINAAARLAGMLITKDTGVGGVEELRPTPPVFSDIPESTSSAAIDVGGFAQPGVEVVLYINGNEHKKIVTDDSGVFEFDNIPLDDGDNTVYAYSVTSRGQESEQSRAYTIAVDKEPPEITLSSPEDGHVYRGGSERIAEFQGMISDEDSRVTVGDRVAIVRSDGTFNLSYQLIEGDQEIIVTATDQAGNNAETKVTLRWEP